MIGTIETIKLVTIELNRADVYNILNGADVKGRMKEYVKEDGRPIDILIYCSDPEDSDIVNRKEE